MFRAEARFLRALSYWHGIDLFGNIPLVTEDDPIGPTPPLQSTRQEIFDFLVSELTAIQADLPAAAGQGTYGRATKEAAAMLLAQAVPERRGLHRHAAVRPGAGRGPGR